MEWLFVRVSDAMYDVLHEVKEPLSLLMRTNYSFSQTIIIGFEL